MPKYEAGAGIIYNGACGLMNAVYTRTPNLSIYLLLVQSGRRWTTRGFTQPNPALSSNMRLHVHFCCSWLQKR